MNECKFCASDEILYPFQSQSGVAVVRSVLSESPIHVSLVLFLKCKCVQSLYNGLEHLFF